MMHFIHIHIQRRGSTAILGDALGNLFTWDISNPLNKIKKLDACKLPSSVTCIAACPRSQDCSLAAVGGLDGAVVFIDWQHSVILHTMPGTTRKMDQGLAPPMVQCIDWRAVPVPMLPRTACSANKQHSSLVMDVLVCTWSSGLINIVASPTAYVYQDRHRPIDTPLPAAVPLQIDEAAVQQFNVPPPTQNLGYIQKQRLWISARWMPIAMQSSLAKHAIVQGSEGNDATESNSMADRTRITGDKVESIPEDSRHTAWDMWLMLSSYGGVLYMHKVQCRAAECSIQDTTDTTTTPPAAHAANPDKTGGSNDDKAAAATATAQSSSISLVMKKEDSKPVILSKYHERSVFSIHAQCVVHSSVEASLHHPGSNRNERDDVCRLKVCTLSMDRSISCFDMSMSCHHIRAEQDQSTAWRCSKQYSRLVGLGAYPLKLVLDCISDDIHDSGAPAQERCSETLVDPGTAARSCVLAIGCGDGTIPIITFDFTPQSQHAQHDNLKDTSKILSSSLLWHGLSSAVTSLMWVPRSNQSILIFGCEDGTVGLSSRHKGTVLIPEGRKHSAPVIKVAHIVTMHKHNTHVHEYTHGQTMETELKNRDCENCSTSDHINKAHSIASLSSDGKIFLWPHWIDLANEDNFVQNYFPEIKYKALLSPHVDSSKKGVQGNETSPSVCTQLGSPMPLISLVAEAARRARRFHSCWENGSAQTLDKERIKVISECAACSAMDVAAGILFLGTQHGYLIAYSASHAAVDMFEISATQSPVDFVHGVFNGCDGDSDADEIIVSVVCRDGTLAVVSVVGKVSSDVSMQETLYFDMDVVSKACIFDSEDGKLKKARKKPTAFSSFAWTSPTQQQQYDSDSTVSPRGTSLHLSSSPLLLEEDTNPCIFAALGFEDGTIQVWLYMASARQVHKICDEKVHASTVLDMSWVPFYTHGLYKKNQRTNLRIVSASDDQTIRSWNFIASSMQKEDKEEGTACAPPLGAHTYEAENVAIHGGDIKMMMMMKEAEEESCGLTPPAPAQPLSEGDVEEKKEETMFEKKQGMGMAHSTSKRKKSSVLKDISLGASSLFPHLTPSSSTTTTRVLLPLDAARVDACNSDDGDKQQHNAMQGDVLQMARALLTPAPTESESSPASAPRMLAGDSAGSSSAFLDQYIQSLLESASKNQQHQQQVLRLAAHKAAILALWNRDIGQAIDILTQHDALTADFVNFSITAGKNAWKATSRAYAQQLEENGEIHLATSYLLSIEDVHAACDLYMKHGCIKEAAMLATTRLPPENVHAINLKKAWASQLESKKDYEHAAMQYLAAREWSKAIEALLMRNTDHAIKTAMDIRDMCLDQGFLTKDVFEQYALHLHIGGAGDAMPRGAGVTTASSPLLPIKTASSQSEGGQRRYTVDELQGMRHRECGDVDLDGIRVLLQRFHLNKRM